MDYEAEPVERVIDRAVGARDDCAPAFYAVTGSHVYGFPCEAGSDVDVRGFHVADGRRYALLDRPDEQIVVNQDGVTEGFEDAAHVDLVSYELRKFGRLVAESNFNVLEAVFCGDRIRNEVPREMEALRSLVEDHLPLNVPAAYVGMARNNYRTRLDPERDGDAPTAKAFLYVLRGLLAAAYVQKEGTIEANVTVLADDQLGETALVEELIAVKRADRDAVVSNDLAEQADEQITALFDRIDPGERRETVEFRDAVDDWMLAVRGEHRET